MPPVMATIVSVVIVKLVTNQRTTSRPDRATDECPSAGVAALTSNERTNACAAKAPDGRALLALVPPLGIRARTTRQSDKRYERCETDE